MKRGAEVIGRACSTAPVAKRAWMEVAALRITETGRRALVAPERVRCVCAASVHEPSRLHAGRGARRSFASEGQKEPYFRDRTPRTASGCASAR